MLEHAVDGLEVFCRLIVELLSFCFQLLESTFRINVYGVFGVFTNIELRLDLLRRLRGEIGSARHVFFCPREGCMIASEEGHLLATDSW